MKFTEAHALSEGSNLYLTLCAGGELHSKAQKKHRKRPT